MCKTLAGSCAWLLTSSLLIHPATHSASQDREPINTPDLNAERAYKVPDFRHNPNPKRFFLAPDTEISRLEGETLTAADLRGRVVLFEFWWSECFSSVRRVSYLKSLTRRRTDDPFTLVSVHIDGDTEEMRQLVEKFSMDWPQYRYSEQLRAQFDIQSYPTHILVDHEGTIAFREYGWSNEVETRLDWEIGRALRTARRADD